MAELTITMTQSMEKAREDHNNALKKANEALKAEPFNIDAYNEALSDIDKAEKDFAKYSALALYDKCAEDENPIIAVIKAYTYPILKHVEVRDEDDKRRILMLESAEGDKQIDLLKFCNRADLPTEWSFTVAKFNKLLCLRAAKTLGANTKGIAGTYYMRALAEQIELGATPTSNTQTCKTLQRVLDAILPQGEDGKQPYKANNYDVGYLDMLYAKKSSKELLTVSVSKDAFLRRLIVDIAYRLITGSKYGVDGYKVKKNK